MAGRRKQKTAELADVPFHEYLWQFYAANRRRIRAGYKPLTRKFLDYNDPGEKETEAYLRKPQFEALEMYVFLKEGCGNKRLPEVFREWQERMGAFEGRGAFRKGTEELSLFEALDAPKFEAAFSRMKAGAAGYPNYIYALAMGLGKTTLMATCIFYEFLLAKKYPEDVRFCHNALVFAPDTTVLQSLREIQTLDKSKVVPPGYVEWLDANLKFQFLDDTSLSLAVLDGSRYNIIISNNQKIILKRSHKDRTAADSLFEADKAYHRAAGDAFAGLDGLDGGIETEEDLLTNQRFEMLKRLTHLGIYVDEAHHAFGNKLANDLTGGEEKSLRTTINELSASLAKVGTRVVACFNYTGTPYAGSQLLPEVVYAYSLRNSIRHGYLKKAEVDAYENTQSREFVRAVTEDFWEKCGERRVEGMLPKLAFFASTIEELENELRPALEDVLAGLGVPTDRILVNVMDPRYTGNDEMREFLRLDTPESEKQFVLLVQRGREGWNCRSLFGVALHRKARSKVFVLQATMRCLRSIGTVQETGRVYLSEENREILANELQENFRLNIDEFISAGETGKKRVAVRMVPPPVTVKLKRVVRHYTLRELDLEGRVDFGLAEIDPAKYDVIKTTTDLERVGRDAGRKSVVEGVKENNVYSALTLTAEIARYLGKSCRAVRRALEASKEGMGAVVEAVNRYNEVLYDRVIPELFRRFFALDEREETEEVELRLVKPPSPPGGGGPKGGGDRGDGVLAEFYVKPDLLASNTAREFAGFAGKSFHLDNYCFDSHPEMDFFRSVLRDGGVSHLYFTGMLTSDKTEFRVGYVDPVSHTLRNYYPDFLVEKADGGYVVVEVKGDDKIDDAVVQAKAEYATAMASASGMDYMMVPGTLAGFGLRQPARLAGAVAALFRVWAEEEVPEAERFVRFLPLYSLKAACGKFGDGEAVEPEGWVEVEGGRPDRRMFAVRAQGRSMEPLIHDGDLCVMRADAAGSREGRIVLAQHRGIADPESGGAYSLKRYHSEKAATADSSWRHERIVLEPLNRDFEAIEIAPEEAEDFKIVAERVENVKIGRG